MESKGTPFNLIADHPFRRKILSIIGHDLRGPVGSIKMLADIILDSPDDFSREELLDTIENISDAAGAAASLLENLVTWAQCINNEVRFNPVRQALEPVLINVVASMRLRAIQKGLNLEVIVAPELFAYFDREMVKIVTRNLLENAIKFTRQQGKITIEAKDLANQMAEITVSDTGTGISEENLERLNSGEPFFTTYGTTNEKGSGLGLMVCRELISRNDGRLTIRANAGSGSSFSFSLPTIKY